MKLDGGIPYCAYILFAQQSRGCRISECDKYKTGIKQVYSRPMTNEVFWRVEND